MIALIKLFILVYSLLAYYIFVYIYSFITNFILKEFSMVSLVGNPAVEVADELNNSNEGDRSHGWY